MSDDFIIEDHYFDINQCSFFYLCNYEATGIKKWEQFNESKKQVSRYWNEINKYIPFDIEPSKNSNDAKNKIHGFYKNKSETTYILSISNVYHLIPKNTLRERDPQSILYYNLSKLQ